MHSNLTLLLCRMLNEDHRIEEIYSTAFGTRDIQILLVLYKKMAYSTVLRKSIRDSLVFRESIPNTYTYQKYQCVLMCTFLY